MEPNQETSKAKKTLTVGAKWITIYCYTHRDSGRKYVGQTGRTIAERWREHVCDSKNLDSRPNSYFHRAIAKYGPDAFDCEILDKVKTQNMADVTETLWIERLDCRVPNGFNLLGGGHGVGLHHPETKKKIGDGAKRYNASITAEQRSDRQKKAAANRIPKTHEEYVRICAPNLEKANAAITPEQRAENGRKSWDLSPEEYDAKVEKLSKSHKAYWESLSDEEKLAVSDKRHEGHLKAKAARQAAGLPEPKKTGGYVPTEIRSANAKETWSSRTTEEKVEISKNMSAGRKKKDAERRAAGEDVTAINSAKSKAAWANKTPEQVAEFKRAAGERMKLRWSNMSPEDRAHHLSGIRSKK